MNQPQQPQHYAPDERHSPRSSQRLRRCFRAAGVPMSIMLDDASEFNEPLALDIAIAKIEASTIPASPTGIRHNKRRKDSIRVTTRHD